MSKATAIGLFVHRNLSNLEFLRWKHMLNWNSGQWITQIHAQTLRAIVQSVSYILRTLKKAE